MLPDVRKLWIHFGWAGLALWLLAGCGGMRGEPELVWGHKGVQDGDFVKPRAVAIDAQDRLFIVDFTARIQAFDCDGQYLGPTWTTPDYRNGRPSGLSIDRDGNIIVSDSHYHCIRIYSPDGKELRKIGGDGSDLNLDYVGDAVQDADGYFFIAEAGVEVDRISKIDVEGRLVKRWGSSGMEPGQFHKIRALALGPDGNLYAADACNHRIQVFTRDGDLVRVWGTPGTQPGELRYPYDLAFGRKGDRLLDELYVVENGNQRVQKFTLDGRSLGCWGGPGREPGRLHNPWALAVDSKGRVHVLDSENHRVQRIEF